RAAWPGRSRGWKSLVRLRRGTCGCRQPRCGSGPGYRTCIDVEILAHTSRRQHDDCTSPSVAPRWGFYGAPLNPALHVASRQLSAPSIEFVKQGAGVELVTRAAGVVCAQRKSVQLGDLVRFEASDFLFVDLFQGAPVQGSTIQCC